MSAFFRCRKLDDQEEPSVLKTGFGLCEWHDTQIDGLSAGAEEREADEFIKAMKDNANRPAPAANGEAAKFFDCEGTARRGPNTADPGSQASINLESDLLTLESGLHSLESGVLNISPSGSFQFSGGGPGSAPELSSDLSELVRAAEPKGGLTDALNRFAAADSVAFGPPPPPIHPPKSANPPSVRAVRMTPMVARPVANPMDSALSSDVPSPGGHVRVGGPSIEEPAAEGSKADRSCRYASASGASSERVKTRHVSVKVPTE